MFDRRQPSQANQVSISAIRVTDNNVRLISNRSSVSNQTAFTVLLSISDSRPD